MSIVTRSTVVALAMGLTLLAPILATASSGEGKYDAQPSDPDYANALKAIQVKDWDKAVTLLNTAVAKDEKNADIHNLLGYSERNRKNMDAAFKHYDRALALNPKHRGAHEYVGEAYLMVGNVAKAEEQLAALDKLCFFPCNEYSELKEKIAEYKNRP
ncbi:MAG: tetratricopeptide repeat protein [Gammaproteobacteria bacterium]|nr:tetratricopeptide repeat protein [Gammaproteobacteria bacterium]